MKLKLLSFPMIVFTLTLYAPCFADINGGSQSDASVVGGTHQGHPADNEHAVDAATALQQFGHNPSPELVSELPEQPKVIPLPGWIQDLIGQYGSLIIGLEADVKALDKLLNGSVDAMGNHVPGSGLIAKRDYAEALHMGGSQLWSLITNTGCTPGTCGGSLTSNDEPRTRGWKNQMLRNFDKLQVNLTGLQSLLKDAKKNQDELTKLKDNWGVVGATTLEESDSMEYDSLSAYSGISWGHGNLLSSQADSLNRFNNSYNQVKSRISTFLGKVRTVIQASAGLWCDEWAAVCPPPGVRVSNEEYQQRLMVIDAYNELQGRFDLGV